MVAGSYRTRPFLFHLWHAVKRGAQSQAGGAEAAI